MSIHKTARKSGRTAYDVRWRDEAGRDKTRRFDRKTDAEKWETEVRRGKQTGDLVSYDGGRITLADFGREWFTNYAKQHLADETCRSYAGSWDRYILPSLGHHTLRRLCADPQVIRDFASELADEKVGPEAIRYALVILQSALQRAVEWQRIPSNPVRNIRKPRSADKREAIVLTPDTIESMRARLLAVGKVRDATLITVLAYAGLRPGEALALRWKHIGARTIHVKHGSNDGTQKETKTGKQRFVRLLGPLADDLRDWRAASEHDTDDDLVFPRDNGSMWVKDDWKNWTNRVHHPLCIAEGIGKYVPTRVKGKTQRAWRAASGEGLGPRPYDLRHSFVSLLIHEGRNVVEVAGQAGHAPTMTLDTYAHVFAEFDPADRRPAEQRIRDARAATVGQTWDAPAQSTNCTASRQRKTPHLRGFVVKPMSGLEPLTPSLRVKCSTS